ncbi:helix-turn-helix domain-containing protein [Candidatus Mycobacterium methanotrophicum]|uniref:helix-turn-helix domain-containing protein n=1 Tax=Candidatus Mycobacterium methanotrophicum TaxID=2943498 RepID=UPI001C578E66
MSKMEAPPAESGEGRSTRKSASQHDYQNDTGHFTKFDWLRTVYGQPEFKDGEKAVLAYVAVFSVMTGGNTFRVRQDTLAERCGVSESTVYRAMKRGKDLGYLAMSRRRKSGTGCHGADELRLTLPESPVKLTTDSQKSPVNMTTDSAESPVKFTRVTRQIDGYIRNNSSLHSSLKEKGPASKLVPAADSHRPPPICSKHPDGPNHDEPCRPCKRWREWQEQEQARTAESQREAVRARNAVRDACSLCDEAGWLYGDDGGATNILCTHEGKGRRTA